MRVDVTTLSGKIVAKSVPVILRFRADDKMHSGPVSWVVARQVDKPEKYVVRLLTSGGAVLATLRLVGGPMTFRRDDTINVDDLVFEASFSP